MTLFEKTRQDLHVQNREGLARLRRHILAALEPVDTERGSVVAPDLGNSNLRVDGHLSHRRAGDIDPDDEIRWRVQGEVQASFSPDGVSVFDVEAGVRLEAPLEILPLKRRRTQVLGLDLEFFCNDLDDLG